MNKFNEKDVPSWCKWIAVDFDGSCWAFTAKPESIRYYKGEWWPKTNAGKQVKLYEGKPPKNWKDELYTWA